MSPQDELFCLVSAGIALMVGWALGRYKGERFRQVMMPQEYLQAQGNLIFDTMHCIGMMLSSQMALDLVIAYNEHQEIMKGPGKSFSTLKDYIKSLQKEEEEDIKWLP